MPTSHVQSYLRDASPRGERRYFTWRAPNALAARIIADLGFKAVYLTGALDSPICLGLPDLGFTMDTEPGSRTCRSHPVCDRRSLPLIVDIDTGFGNAVNVTHTVRIVEQAGAASTIQIEDQHAPKRCGHFDGKEFDPRGGDGG